MTPTSHTEPQNTEAQVPKRPVFQSSAFQGSAIRRVTLIDPFSTGHHTPYAVMLCQQLTRHGVRVSVVGPEALVSACRQEAMIHQSAVLDLYQGDQAGYYGKGKWHEERASYQFVRRALELARGWDSEIAHFVFLDSFILSLLAALRLNRDSGAGRMRVHTTLHWAYMLPRFQGGGRFAGLRAAAQFWALRQLLRGGTRLQVHTQSFVNDVGRRTVPGSVSYVPYPAEDPLPENVQQVAALRGDLGVDPDVQLLLAFGGTRRNKGVDVAIRALAHLPQHYHLMVVGPEEDFTAEFMTDLARQLGVEDRFHLRLGYLKREQYEPYFAAAVTAVLPYTPHFSGQSGVMFTAGVMGTPVVASDAGTIAESVNHFGLGETFSNAGSPDEVAADMARAVCRASEQRRSPEVRRQRQAHFAQAHSLDRFGNSVLADYQLGQRARLKSWPTSPQSSFPSLSYAAQESAMSEPFAKKNAAKNEPSTP